MDVKTAEAGKGIKIEKIHKKYKYIPDFIRGSAGSSILLQGI